MSQLCTLHFITFILYFTTQIIQDCLGLEVELTSPLASAICGQWAEYKETGVIQDSLEEIPKNIPILNSCDNWLWNKCNKRGKKDCGSFEYVQKCIPVKHGRVLGGKEAGPAEFPWDASIRFIYDWGTFYPEPRPKEDVAANDFKGLKEAHRCTATIYSPSFLLTSAWCGSRAKAYLHTRNRFVVWLARGKFLDAKQIEMLPGKPARGDVFVHPSFPAEVVTQEKQDLDHDISIVKLPKPFKFSKEVYGLKVAPPGKTFVGDVAVFTGWGTTNSSITATMIGDPVHTKKGYGSKLYKLNLVVIPFNGICKETIIDYLEINDDFDANEDLSTRYVCAKAIKKDDTEKGACGGDIGGPLICTDNGQKYLCGIRNSWSIMRNCPSKTDIEIFINPSYYLEWIEKIAGKQDPNDLKPPENKKG